MLRRGFFEVSKKACSRVLMSGMLNKFPKMSFSTVDVEGIKNILKNEIKHEETNYSPVDQKELKTFFQNTEFQFVDTEGSLNMELRKTKGNFELIINFQAKPPLPQEEQQQEGEEKSKI
jgi:hypothetical protein